MLTLFSSLQLKLWLVTIVNLFPGNWILLIMIIVTPRVLFTKYTRLELCLVFCGQSKRVCSQLLWWIICLATVARENGFEIGSTPRNTYCTLEYHYASNSTHILHRSPDYTAFWSRRGAASYRVYGRQFIEFGDRPASSRRWTPMTTFIVVRTSFMVAAAGRLIHSRAVRPYGRRR